jgi:hypothetical protein
MKKIILFAAALALAGITTYAQTDRTNRTKTREHDRTETTPKNTAPANQQSPPPDRMNQRNDVDRNNTNNNTNTSPNGIDPKTNNSANPGGGVNTNGGTGTSGGNINSNNPR